MFHLAVCCCVSIGIFDAGSTGTRLKIFDIENGRLNGEIKYKIEGGIHEKSTEEIEETLKRFSNINSGNNSNSNNSSINNREGQQPLKRFNNIEKMGFYGTAGLRLEDKNRQNEILKIVRDKLKDSNLVESKILSGLEEAFYAQKAFEYYISEEDYVLVDMGGRSVQIIYKNEGTVKMSSLDMGVLKSEKCNIYIERYENNSKNRGDSFNNNTSRNKRDPFNNNTSRNRGDLFNNNTSNNSRNNRGEVIVDDCSLIINEGAFKEFICNKTNGIPNPAILQPTFLPLQNNKIDCIDEIFKNTKLEKIGKTKKIYLISYFEELLQDEDLVFQDLDLSILIDKFLQGCPQQNFTNKENTISINKNKENNDTISKNKENFTNKNKDCLKKYYSLRFLEEIGIDKNIPIVMINKKMNVDISWPLGKALELSEQIVL